MQPHVIEMTPLEAAAKASAYRKALARRSDPEYFQALTIYDALAKGTTLIDVGAAIREGGFDEKMRPNLAIARADRRQVHFRWWSGEQAEFNTNHETGPGRKTAALIESIGMQRESGRSYVQGYALVPIIPADVRPRGNARNWHILWEVEQWADRRIDASADEDPYLLRRLSGDVFIVLAEWDLTEVEQLVTQGRALVRS